MSTVKEIEDALRQLSPAEIQQVQEFLEDLIEDHLEFTDEFKAQIERSKLARREGRFSRKIQG